MPNSSKVINEYDLEDVSLTLGKVMGEWGRVIIFPVSKSDFHLPDIMQKMCDRAND